MAIGIIRERFSPEARSFVIQDALRSAPIRTHFAIFVYDLILSCTTSFVLHYLMEMMTHQLRPPCVFGSIFFHIDFRCI